jgi:membrane protease YdiL (CAAX protease family)
MYLEQGYLSKGGRWKYLPFPLVFIALIAWNFYTLKSGDINVEETMQQMVNTFGKNLFLFINLMQFVLGFGFLLLLVKLVHKQPLRALVTSRKKIDWKRVRFSILLWGLVVLSTTLLGVYANPESYEIQFNLSKFIPLFIVVVLMVPIQTSFEELLFRSYMMQGFGVLLGRRWIPFIISSLLFGLMHIGNPEIEKMGYVVLLFYVGTGFFLGLITLMDEGVELALGFHAINNTLSALLVTSSWTAFQTDSVFLDTSVPNFGLEVIFPVFIVYPIMIYIFAKKYRWTGWRNKLFGKLMSEEKFLIQNEH